MKRGFGVMMLIFMLAGVWLFHPVRVMAASPEEGDFGQFEVLDQILGQGATKDINTYASGSAPFTGLLNRIVQIVIGITVLVGVGAIVFGGYLYMTAQGNASQVEKGKDFIKTALLAIALAVGSVLLLNTINPNLAENLQEPTLGQ